MDIPPPSAKSQQRRFQESEQHPVEVSLLIPQALLEDQQEGLVLLRHDSEFSVGSNYEYSSPNNLKVWQGAALLTADCLGTGILALPGDIQVLGYGLGLGFLIANLPINLFAGTILSHSATHVEESQGVANQIYHESLSDANTTTSKEQAQHTQLHHDTATFDFIGMTQALFHDKVATRLVKVRVLRCCIRTMCSYGFHIVCATGVCLPQNIILISAAVLLTLFSL
jgi:hypothetical protein